MAQAAVRYDCPTSEAADQAESIHGPLAALHQAIEAGLRFDRAAALLAAPTIPGPVERSLRLASCMAGWGVLASGFVTVGLLLSR